MNRNITILVLILLVVSVQSCTKKEDVLQPSTKNQGYLVPQGASDYDTTIANFYKKYGKYLLYNFTDKDTYWTPSVWKNAYITTSGAWSPGYLVTQSNPAYVKKQLALLNKQWLGLYSDKFLTDFLPVKIMLCTTVDSVWSIFNFTTTPISYSKGSKAVAAWYNYDNICISNGGANGVDSMKTRDSINYLAKANFIFVQSIIGRNLNKANSDFSILTNYTITITSNATAYANGILPPYPGATANADWGSYMLAMVSTSQANLSKSVANTDATYNGILNATKDANGLIKKRYDIIRNYFITNYNVDLQAIGNLANR